MQEPDVSKQIVIAGAGHAAGQVVATLKQKKFDGRIVLVGDEAFLPYQRPPLSKKFLAGDMPAERLHLKPASFYEDPNIDVRLETRIASIDRRARTVSTEGGDSIAYDTLVLATGSRVRKVPVEGSDLSGVHYLRSINDVSAIRGELENAKQVVIIGAGYIGLEVAAVFRQLGLDVTVIEMADRVMSRVVSPQVSEFYQKEHLGHGVKLELSTGLKAFVADQQDGNRVTAVETSDGRRIPADFVVVGVGIIPNTELAEDAGLTVDNGIVVDERCQSSDPDIYAVGDCTLHPSNIYARSVRLESVHNALEQAKTAATNACGESLKYSQVPWFWSDQYDLKLQIAGLSEGYDSVIIRGKPKDRAFACLYLRDDRLIAIDAINSPRDFMQAKALIANAATPARADLANTRILLKDLG
jgi:3-phenylpropionate/trans-cinnamate dioxygenase ferredoxin reductase subunit